MKREAVGSRIEPVHPGLARYLTGLPGRLDVAYVENAPLVVDVTVRTVIESVRAVMRVRGIQPAQKNLPHVGLVVAVRVFQKE